MSSEASEAGERVRHRRLRRLREELEDAGLALPDDGPLAQRIIDELDYARYPPVHEASLPSFGALLVAGEDTPDSIREHVAAIDLDDVDMLRSLADGRHSFVLRTRSRCGLLLFDVAHDREADLVRLRRNSGAVIVQRIPRGTVRLLTTDRLWIWDGSRWWSKAYAESYKRGVLAALPEVPADVLHEILDFCVHTMSPADAGAALIWFLPDRKATRVPGLSAGRAPIPLPGLGLVDIASRAAIRQLLSQLDGAAVLDREGRLIAVGAHLRSSRRSHETVPLDPRRGTRHASARRYTFDHDSTVAFVVSRDGPVTVYARGSEIAVIGRDHDNNPEEPLATHGGL